MSSINCSLGVLVNFLLPEISVVQGNLNSDTTVCEPGYLEQDASHQWSSVSRHWGQEQLLWSIITLSPKRKGGCSLQ